MVQQVNKPFGRLNCPIYCQRSQWFLSWLLSLDLTAFDQILP